MRNDLSAFLGCDIVWRAVGTGQTDIIHRLIDTAELEEGRGLRGDLRAELDPTLNELPTALAVILLDAHHLLLLLELAQ